MTTDEQQSRPINEIVKFVLNTNSSTNPLQVEIQMPVQLEKIYMSEAETQTSTEEDCDLISKEAGDEARLTGSNKYGVLSLDEYQIIRTGEEHCLKKYFSDDDVSLSDEDLPVDKQMKQMNLDEGGDRTVVIENLNNNASTLLHSSHSDLSNTLLLDDTTHLSATLAQSTSSRISHSRYLETFKEEDDDDELDQLVASTFTPMIEAEKTVPSPATSSPDLSSIRWFVRQAINSCQENLTFVNRLLESIPSSYEHILQRKVRRTNCIINTPNPIKGLQYSPSTSVQTE